MKCVHSTSFFKSTVLCFSVSCESVKECQSDELADEKCSKLKKAVHDYFETNVTEFENQEPKLLVKDVKFSAGVSKLLINSIL